MSYNTVNTMVAERVLAVNKDNWNYRIERILTPQLLQLIDLLHELFFDSRNQNLIKRHSEFKIALKNSSEIFSTSDSSQSNGAFSVEVQSALKQVRSVVSVSPDSTHQLIKHFTNTDPGNAVDALIFDFEDGFKSSLSNLVTSYNNLTEIVSGNARYIPRKNQFQFSAAETCIKPPHIIMRVRGLHQNECSLMFGNEFACASIVDLVYGIYNQVKFLNPLQKQITILIPKCYDAAEATWWQNLLLEIEEIFGLKQGSIRVIIEAGSTRNCVQLEMMIHELQNRITGIYANMRTKFFDDLRHQIKRTGEILPARIDAETDSAAMLNFLNYVCRVASKFNLHSIAGLTLNAAGNLYDASEDEQVAVYEQQIDALCKIRFDAMQVTHASFAQRINFSKSSINASAALTEMFNYGVNKISIKALRDNLRASIEFMHAWEQNIACAFFDNRYEDVVSFDIIRAQIRQWITNNVITTEGEKINSRLVTMLLLEESEKLKLQLEEEFEGNPTAEMRTILNTYTQSTLRLEHLLLDENVPVFFNSGQLR